GGGQEGLTSAGEGVATMALTLDCPDAYWTSTNYQTFIVSQTGDATTFLETLPEVYLQPSDTFGAVRVNNPGRVPSWVDFELRGPFTRVEVSKDGEGWV